MLCLGNSKANAILETDQTNFNRPATDSPWDVREKFIRAKYQLKQFIEPFPSNSPWSCSQSLYFAIKQDQPDWALQLLCQGADPNYQDPSFQDKKTALHAAVIYDTPGLAELLLQRFADPDVVDFQQRTPLHHCALLGRTLCAIALMKRKVNIEAKDQDGKRPVDLAVMNQQVDSVALFRLAQLSIQERQAPCINQQSSSLASSSSSSPNPAFEQFYGFETFSDALRDFYTTLEEREELETSSVPLKEQREGGGPISNAYKIRRPKTKTSPRTSSEEK